MPVKTWVVNNKKWLIRGGVTVGIVILLLIALKQCNDKNSALDENSVLKKELKDCNNKGDSLNVRIDDLISDLEDCNEGKDDLNRQIAINDSICNAKTDSLQVALDSCVNSKKQAQVKKKVVTKPAAPKVEKTPCPEKQAAPKAEESPCPEKPAEKAVTDCPDVPKDEPVKSRVIKRRTIEIVIERSR